MKSFGNVKKKKKELLIQQTLKLVENNLRESSVNTIESTLLIGLLPAPELGAPYVSEMVNSGRASIIIRLNGGALKEELEDLQRK